MENDLRSSMIIGDCHSNANQRSTQQETASSSHKSRTPNSDVNDEMSLLSEEFNNVFKDIFKEIEHGNFQIPFSDPNGLFSINSILFLIFSSLYCN